MKKLFLIIPFLLTAGLPFAQEALPNPIPQERLIVKDSVPNPLEDLIVAAQNPEESTQTAPSAATPQEEKSAAPQKEPVANNIPQTTIKQAEPAPKTPAQNTAAQQDSDGNTQQEIPSPEHNWTRFYFGIAYLSALAVVVYLLAKVQRRQP